MRRIVVTGMGAVSPLGCGVETNWSRLLAGRSGIRTLPEAITADLSARVGGQVPDVAVDPEGGFDQIVPLRARTNARWIVSSSSRSGSASAASTRAWCCGRCKSVNSWKTE
jgi:3-oxoacyl-(acyl-carrier-protein) synthase